MKNLFFARENGLELLTYAGARKMQALQERESVKSRSAETAKRLKARYGATLNEDAPKLGAVLPIVRAFNASLCYPCDESFRKAAIKLEKAKRIFR